MGGFLWARYPFMWSKWWVARMYLGLDVRNRAAFFVFAVLRYMYRGTSLIRNRHPPGPYSRAMPSALRWS